MAIIVDPDNLDRNQIIFNTAQQKVSVYPAGAINGVRTSDGVAVGSATTFTSSTSTFTSNNVQVGDILCIFTGDNAGHYQIASINSETSLTVNTFNGFTGFAAESGLVFDIRDSTGGTAVDGATLQAIYSFTKEEWRVDTEKFDDDDLVRHEFPFEAITSEQFEIGGGTAHADWIWFAGPVDSDRTVNYIRTAGWAEKNTAGTTLSEYAGVVTLGTLDPDAQVYYQQSGVFSAPNNFVLTGQVNQSVIVNSAGTGDLRNYLKLFVRKKGKTYGQSEISDIGVSTIQTIANRFPLAHVADPAIVATDGAILGTNTWRGQRTLTSAANGAKNSTASTFTSATSTFLTAGVAAGDTLVISSGNELGRYTIAGVDSETELTIAEDFEFSTWAETESSLSFNITTTYYFLNSTARIATDGAIANVDGNTGTITSSSSNFTTAGIQAGDMVIISETGSDHRGVYKIVSVDSSTSITVNTTDQIFTAISNLDFSVVKPGMYLQYKNDDVELAATGDLDFSDANPDTITRASGSWVTDGVLAGDIISISGTESHDGSYTIAYVAETVLTLITSDIVAPASGITANVSVSRPFKRAISGITYGYNWRLYGIDASASNCYQFVQHQLRQTIDIDHGPNNYRGDVTDLLMTYSTPTGTTLNMVIDDVNAADLNNVVFTDATESGRNYPFLAAGTLGFNDNLRNDVNARYWMFYTTNPSGNYSTKDAIIVRDSDENPISGVIGGQGSISFTFDYDGNVQGGRTAGTDASVTLVAMGLDTAQFVIATGTISRSKSNNFSLVSALERNYTT